MSIENRHVCGCCFKTFPSSSVNSQWPTCPDCESEAISVDLIPMRDFLLSPDESKLDEIREAVMGDASLHERYRKAVVQRIDKLIEQRDKLV